MMSQLMMMSTTMKQMKFNVLSAENGYEAYNNFCKLIEVYNKVRLQLL